MSRSVLYNPFSSATAQPKIPDGKCYASLGTKRNLVATSDFKTGESFREYVLMPNLIAPLVELGPEATATAITEYVTPFAKRIISLNRAANIGGKTALSQLNSKEVTKFRVVSQGLKMTLVNSTDDNDGWFEAFRFKPDYVTETKFDEAGITALPVGADIPDTMSYPSLKAGQIFGLMAAGGQRKFNMAEKGNYVTGKLRNIHRYTWQNKRVSTDKDFMDIPTGGTLSPANLFDNEFDTIIIRVHGMETSKLMLHVTQNVEYICSESHDLHNFMTKSPNYRTYSAPYRTSQGLYSIATRYRRMRSAMRRPMRRRVTTRRPRRPVMRRRTYKR